ncbi:MAG: hypothetical protein QXK24_08890 [Ignisphaera sp.]
MKNEIQELQLAPSDVQAITPKVLAATIEEIARHKRIWAQFYKENRDLMNKGGTAVEFPKKKAGVTAAWNLSPGQGPSASNMTYAAVTISVKKGGIGLAFRGEAIRQAMRDVIQDAITEAGEVWADTLDIVALEAMFPPYTTIATGAATLDLGNKIPIGFKYVAGTGTLQVTSPTSAKIVVTGPATFSFWYIPETAAEGEPIGAKLVTNSLSAKDLLMARSAIIAKKYNPNVIVIHPDRLADILYDPTVKFLEKSAYEGEGPIYTGEIGRIWGLKVIVSNKCPRFGAVLIDTDRLGYHVIRKPLKLTRDDYTGMSIDTLYFWGFSEENFGVVNAQAYGAVALSGTFTIDSSVVQ